jgi:hypothetical protein
LQDSGLLKLDAGGFAASEGSTNRKVGRDGDLRASRGRRFATLSHLSRDKTAAKMGHPL